jgi:hypothetical protein
MPPLKINADGTLPYHRDARGQPYLDEDVEAAIVSAGGPHDHDATYEAAGAVATHAATPHGGEAGPHDHDGDYEPVHGHPYSASGHNHDGTYAATHAHPYSADNHSHVLTEPDIPAAIARDTEVSAAITAHLGAATHGGEASHPDLATHEGLGLVTDTDLTTHAGTAHGTQPHAIDGADHTGSLTAADVGAATSGHNHDAAYSATAHNHDAAYATDDHTHPGGSEAFPVGSVFLSVVSTNPATLLGYGTWSAFGQGRMLLGWNTGDTDEATGGAATHTHAGHSDHGALSHTGTAVAAHNVTQPNAHTDVPTHTHTTDSQGAHVHDEYRNSATTGGLDGWGAGDTSTNTPTLTGYDTGSAGGHTHTAAAPAGAVASQPHTGTAVDAHSVTQPGQHAAQSHSAHDNGANTPPYVIVRMWKRTA